MKEEIVSVLVHSPDNKNDTPKTIKARAQPSHGGSRNGKPSRRWLLTELEQGIKKNAELSAKLKAREESERTLIESKIRLERDLAMLKSRKATGSHENEAIRERNKQLSQDIFLMKNILVKLNAELEWYQGKLRKYENEVLKARGCLNEDTVVEKPGDERHWLDGELSLFAPLVTAYEESLAEKEQLIKDLREALQKFSGKMKDVISENTQLRERIADSDKQGDVTYADWVGVQREMGLITEQNLLLKRQSALAQAKISQLKAAYLSKLGEVTCERDEKAGQILALREEHFLLKGKYASLEQEYQRLKEEGATHMPQSVHAAYIAECKRLLDELKSRHEQERDLLLKKTCNHNFPVSKENEFAEIRKLESDLQDIQERYVKSEQKREVLKGRIEALVLFSKELITEHENLLKAVGGELGANINLTSRLDSIKKQLQGVETETVEQLRQLEENIATQVLRVDRQCSQQRSEIDRLRQQLLSHDQLQSSQNH